MKKFIREFFAVTVKGEIWEGGINAYTSIESGIDTYEPIVIKIGECGRLTKPIIRLNQGSYLAITKTGLKRFFPPATMLRKGNESVLIELPNNRDKDSELWGDSTKPIAGLFIDANKAILASQQNSLMQNDGRFEEDTNEAIKKIGLDHPIFAFSFEPEFIFPGMTEIFSGKQPLQRIILPKSSKPERLDEPVPQRPNPWKSRKSVARKPKIRAKENGKSHQGSVSSIEDNALSAEIALPKPGLEMVESTKHIFIRFGDNLICKDFFGSNTEYIFLKGHIYRFIEVKIYDVIWYIFKKEFDGGRKCYGKAASAWRDSCEISENGERMDLQYSKEKLMAGI